MCIVKIKPTGCSETWYMVYGKTKECRILKVTGRMQVPFSLRKDLRERKGCLKFSFRLISQKTCHDEYAKQSLSKVGRNL